MDRQYTKNWLIPNIINQRKYIFWKRSSELQKDVAAIIQSYYTESFVLPIPYGMILMVQGQRGRRILRRIKNTQSYVAECCNFFLCQTQIVHCNVFLVYVLLYKPLNTGAEAKIWYLMRGVTEQVSSSPSDRGVSVSQSVVYHYIINWSTFYVQSQCYSLQQKFCYYSYKPFPRNEKCEYWRQRN